MIVPNSNLIVMSGVPFSSNYQHTILFNSPAEQRAYFAGKAKYRFTDFTYIRQNGYIAVEGSADKYYDCNYCCFMNSGYGTKMFYAFISEVRYVNDDTTWLFIDIDLMQSWMFDFEIDKCFVEREHVSDDTIGKNTVPENIPFGDLVTLSTAEYKYQPIVVAKYASDSYSGSVVNNVYDPLVTEDDPSAIAGILKELEETPERVAFIKMGAQAGSATLGIARTASAFSFNGDSYTPKNNKLYTYPYTALYVDDYGTNSTLYKWEDFSDPKSVTFTLRSETRPMPFMACIPNSYKGNTSATNYMMIKTDFPDCPYIIDNFRAWLSSVGAKQSIGYQAMVQQQTVADTSQLVNAILGTAGNIASGNVVGAQLQGAGSAADIYMGRQSREIQRDTAKQNMAVDFSYAETHGVSIGGQFGGGCMPWYMGLIGWRCISQCIKPEYARIVDDFFTRFGYKVNRYKVPAIKSRSTFNYVKTIAATITGNIPDYAESGICAIFDRGITLWHTTDVGNYSLSNAILMKGVEDEGI